MDIAFEHKIKYEEPLSVEVEWGQRGGYGWTIKYHGSMVDAVIDYIKDTDLKLRALFLVAPEEAKDVA